MNYDIHGMMKINSNVDLGLPYFEVERVDPNLKIMVDDFEFDKRECSKADLWFYGREDEDFIYYERYIFNVKDKLLLEGLRNETTKITATGFCYKKPLRARGSFDNLLNSVQMLKLSQSGVFIHAACVARDGFAVLMPAMPSTGKTLTTLQLLNKGYEYMADDSLIVDGSGTAYCNPRSSAVAPYILNYVNRLSGLRRAELQIRSFLRNFPGATKVVGPYMGKAWELVAGTKVAPNAKVTVVCLLEVGPRGVEELDKKRALNKLMAINRYSLPRPQSNPVILTYTLFNPQFDLSLFEERERNLLSKLLDKTECYIVRCRNGRWGKLVEQALRR